MMQLAALIIGGSVLTALAWWALIAVMRRAPYWSAERQQLKRDRRRRGRWEVVADEDGKTVRVRWSVEDANGAHLYVGHYPHALEFAAQRNAAERNAAWIRPETDSAYQPKGLRRTDVGPGRSE